MNKTYDISRDICSNTGIYDAFYAQIAEPAFERKNAAYSCVKSICKALTGTTARRLAKVTGATLSLLGLVGIAGGIQQNRISILGGIMVAAILLGVEFVCLKSFERNQNI